MTNLTNRAWWKAAALRALYTAVAIAIPYIAATQLTDVPWLMVASAVVVGAILSLATSLFGLPESERVNLPWWLAAIERVTKTFAQSLAAGLTGATFLHDVDWQVVLQAAIGAAFISLLRLILATLPADPTAKATTLVINGPTTFNGSGVLPVAVDDVIDASSQERYPLRRDNKH